MLFGCVANVKKQNIIDTYDLSCKSCNVIFLDIDLLRADFVGLLNKQHHTTPNIDVFFEKAIIFEDVSASSGVTAISNAATLMARDGEFVHALLRNTYVDTPPQMPYQYLRLYSKLPTIAEILHENDYETINLNHGWYAGMQMQLDRGIDIYWGSGEVGASDNVPGKIFKKTTQIIKDKINDQNKFYLLVRSEDLRGLPYRYPRSRQRIKDPRILYKKMGENRYDIYFQPLSDGTLTTKFPAHAKVNWLTESEIKDFRKLSQALYSQQLLYVDEELGKLFKIIENSHLLNNTIIVLYSNHGDGLYDNRVPNHGVSYQSCISVPIIIRHPKITKAIRVKEAVELIDLVPTIYEMLLVSPPAKVDGANLIPIINGEQNSKSYFYGTDKESKYVRQGKMKLIVWADRKKELYNLSEDPGENNNIAEKYPQLIIKLYEQMVNHEIEQLDRALILLNKYRNELGR